MSLVVYIIYTEVVHYGRKQLSSNLCETSRIHSHGDGYFMCICAHRQVFITQQKNDVTYKDPSHVQQNKKVNTLVVGHLQGFKLQIT